MVAPNPPGPSRPQTAEERHMWRYGRGLPVEFGAAVVVFWLDLKGGVADVVPSVEDVPGLVEDRVGVSVFGGHEVDGGDVHFRGQCPNVQVVYIDYALDG